MCAWRTSAGFPGLGKTMARLANDAADVENARDVNKREVNMVARRRKRQSSRRRRGGCECEAQDGGATSKAMTRVGPAGPYTGTKFRLKLEVAFLFPLTVYSIALDTSNDENRVF